MFGHSYIMMNLKQLNEEAYNRNPLYYIKKIKEKATSATLYTSEKKVTNLSYLNYLVVYLQTLFGLQFFKKDRKTNWQNELVSKIPSMKKDDAIKYMKKNFTTFDNPIRDLAGQKTALNSDNNYYMVRDFNIFFEELKKNSLETSAKKIQ